MSSKSSGGKQAPGGRRSSKRIAAKNKKEPQKPQPKKVSFDASLLKLFLEMKDKTAAELGQLDYSDSQLKRLSKRKRQELIVGHLPQHWVRLHERPDELGDVVDQVRREKLKIIFGLQDQCLVQG